jgi:hypothetical protein
VPELLGAGSFGWSQKRSETLIIFKITKDRISSGAASFFLPETEQYHNGSDS